MKCVQISINGVPTWTLGDDTAKQIHFDLAFVPDLQVDLTGPVGTFIASGLVYRSSQLPGGDGVCTQILNPTDTVEVRIVESETPDDLWKDKTEECRRPFGPGQCSFCGRERHEVAHLIPGPDVSEGLKVHICDECVNLCNAIIDEWRR